MKEENTVSRNTGKRKFKKLSFLLLFGLLTAMLLMPMSVSAAAKLNKKSAQIYIGKSVKLKVTGKKGKVKWQSANTSIASVSSSGVVKGKKAGKTTITAKVGSTRLKCTVRVKQALTVDKKSITINDVGSTAKIKVNFFPTGTVYYQIADTDIVSAKWGKREGFPDYVTVTGKQAGTTSIKIYNNYNKEVYNVAVTVKSSAQSYKTPFDKLAAEIKNVNFLYEGSYSIAKSLGTGISLVIQYDESQGTICFTEVLEGSTKGIIQMTIYKNSDKCYLYVTMWKGSNAIAYEKTTTCSQIRSGGYLSFRYIESLEDLIGTPSYSEQKSVNELFNLFLKGCSYTIPGTYHGTKVSTQMKDVFPNF